VICQPQHKKKMSPIWVTHIDPANWPSGSRVFRGWTHLRQLGPTTRPCLNPGHCVFMRTAGRQVMLITGALLLLTVSTSQAFLAPVPSHLGSGKVNGLRRATPATRRAAQDTASNPFADLGRLMSFTAKPAAPKARDPGQGEAH
jgi:hypothetical protein